LTVAGECWVVAEVFFVAKAEGTGAVGAADPGDADACALREFGRVAFDDFAYDLVTQDQWALNEGDVAFEDVEVGATDSAGEDAEEQVVARGGGARYFFDLEGLVGDVEDGCFHGRAPWSGLTGLTQIGTDDSNQDTDGSGRMFSVIAQA
jgi:hypothetical protein